MKRKRINKTQTAPVPTGAATGTGTAAALTGASLVSGSGGTTFMSCPPDDDSFYCKFTRGFNIMKMILAILVMIAIIIFAIWYFTKMKKNKK